MSSCSARGASHSSQHNLGLPVHCIQAMGWRRCKFQLSSKTWTTWNFKSSDECTLSRALSSYQRVNREHEDRLCIYLPIQIEVLPICYHCCPMRPPSWFVKGNQPLGHLSPTHLSCAFQRSCRPCGGSERTMIDT